MTLREFLLKNAPRDEMRRRQCRDEWIAAVDQLLAQLRGWLTETGTAELLDLEPLEFDKREQGLVLQRLSLTPTSPGQQGLATFVMAFLRYAISFLPPRGPAQDLFLIPL
ncbi:MAG TPA: hypothetical protein VH682_30345, partial [Gemmataceae bacterium]